jgi:hypothetical protein
MDTRHYSRSDYRAFWRLKKGSLVIPLNKAYIRALCVWGAVWEPLVFSGNMEY